MKKFSSKLKNLAIFSIIFFGVLGIAKTSQAATYYVDGSCGSSGNGTTAVCGANGPWKTLAEANNSVTSGTHTINVAAGTYNESITETHSGTNSTNFLHWKANGTVTTYQFVLFGDYIKIEGFTLTRPTKSSTGAIAAGTDHTGSVIESCIFDGTLSPGISGHPNASYITVNNCTFYQVACTAINLTATNDHWTITNNDISHTLPGDFGAGSDDANGINLNGSNHLVRGNYIHDILYTEVGDDKHIDGIQWNGPDSGTGTIIERNYIYLWQEAKSGIVSSSGFMFGGSNGTIIRYNIVEAWNGYHTGNSGTPTGIKIYNNIFRSNIDRVNFYWGAGIDLTGGTNHEIYNNIFINFPYAGRGAHHIVVQGGATYAGNNNIFWNDDSSTPTFYGYTPGANDKNSTNPLFVTNYTNLQLQSGSPAINAGLNLGLTQDYAGVSVPQGLAPDIGAYEYVSGGGDTNPPAAPTGLRIL